MLARCKIAAIALAAALGAGACRHVPSQHDVEVARNKHDVAVAHMSEGRYRAALAELLEAEKLNPNDPEVHYALALCYFYGFHRLPEAKRHLERAIELRENYSEALNLYGIILMDEGKFAEAVPYFRKALANLLYATPQFAQQNLGWALYKSGKVEEGLAELEGAVRRSPRLCGGYDQLGIAYSEQGKPEKVVSWLELFRQRCVGTELSKYVGDERIGAALNRLALAYQKLGQRDRAKEVFAQCAKEYGSTAAGAECKKSLAVLP